MLKIKTYALLLISVLGLAMFTSCEDPNNKPGGGNTPEVVMEKSEMNVGYEGGTFTIKFTVNNPVEGQGAIATPEQDWISEVFVDDLNGIITFDVAENGAKETRSSLVEVNYPGVEQPAEFVVIQEGNTIPLFTIENVESTLTTVTFDMIPLHKTQNYLVNTNTPEYISDYGLEDDEALYQDDMEYFAWLGNWYGQSALDILNERAKTGDVLDMTLTNCVPGSEHVVYAYYVDVVTGERTSEITRYNVRSASVELQDIEFDWTIEVDENYAYVEITPENYSGNYYFDVLYVQEVEDYIKTYGGTTEDYIEYWWNSLVSEDIAQGATPHDIMSAYCSQGFDTYEFDLWQDSEYYLVAFTVQEDAFCGSVPKYEVFETGTVPQSDLVVTPYVENIKSFEAKVGYEASNSTDPYLSGVIAAAEFESYGSTEEAKIIGLLTAMNGNLQTSVGSFSGQMSGLTPGTEYVSFAFGYRGGIPTTGLYTTNFTTLTDDPGNATVEIVNTIGYFNLYEIAELNSNYAGTANSYGDTYGYYPAEIISQPFGAKIYYESYAFASEAHFDQFIEENPNYFRDNLLYYGVKPVGRQIFWVEYNKYTVIVSFAEDNEGRYSKMNFIGVNATIDQTSDAQLFIDWLNGGASIAPNYVELREPAVSEVSSIQTISNGVEVVKEVAAPSRARYSTREDVASEIAPAVSELSAIR
ncbi:MAG: BACON domain-containing protein [Bacteroidales bacterium]|nr:BACON domain-containing protein [Bacteroidales bacterium]MBO7284453.1 BACON domain-containing protein [Bacteroidales bacterium]